MKVLINFEPLELISVCARIREEYKNKYDYENPPSGRLEKLINEISGLGMTELEDYALLIKDHDIEYLAYHLPTEKNIILNKKILKIILLRISNAVFESYFVSWQKNYNKLSNKMGERNLFELLNKNNVDYLDRKIYNKNLLTKMLMQNADELLAEYVAEEADKTQKEIDTLIYENYHIRPESVLGVNIRKKIYINCSESRLIKVSDDGLCNIVTAYILEDKLKFFINFVSKVSPLNLKKYMHLANLARNYFRKNTADFDKLPQPIKLKFKMWFSLLDIDNIFGEDERGVFWKARAIENNAVNIEKINSYNMVIMHFEKFVATEFILKSDGPIYIVSIEEYNDKLKKCIVYSNSKSELKRLLYENYRYTDYRIEHRGDWRSNAVRMINYLK